MLGLCIWNSPASETQSVQYKPFLSSCKMCQNIQHFNPQSHVTGPKNSNGEVCGVFDMSLKNAEFICGEAAATRLLHAAPVGGGSVCHRQWGAGSAAVGLAVSSQWSSDVILMKMFIGLSPRCVVGQNLSHNSNNNNNKINVIIEQLWRRFWMSVVSLSQTSLHTHSTAGETPPGGVTTIHVG